MNALPAGWPSGLVQLVSGEKHDAKHAYVDHKDQQCDLKLPHLSISFVQRKGSNRPQTITPAHANKTTAPIHFAVIGALSPALTFQSRSETEK